jgi:hypothetical protein
MTSTCMSNRSLEVVDEDPLEPLPGVDGVVLRLSSQVSGAGSKAIRK